MASRRLSSRLRHASATCLLAFALAISLPAPPLRRAVRAQDVPPFANLQVLPEEIPREELIDTMKRITRALGVDCRFCHRTDIPDFASDEIEAKRVARQMMEMVAGMNRALSAPDAPNFTCFTCHRGRRKPP